MSPLFRLGSYVVALGFLVGCTFVLVWTWVVAFLSGGTILVSVNSWGEAHLELVFFVFCIVVCFFVANDFFKKLVRRKYIYVRK